VYLILITLTYKKNKDLKFIVDAFLAIGVFPLIFSGTYINSPLFFAYIGFAINVLINKKNEKLLRKRKIIKKLNI